MKGVNRKGILQLHTCDCCCCMSNGLRFEPKCVVLMDGELSLLALKSGFADTTLADTGIRLE